MAPILLEPLVLGSGTPLLTLHGAIGLVNHGSLRPWLDHLAEEAQVVFYDQWGDGVRDPRDATLEALVDEAETVRSKCGLERVVVLGHSFGASLALEYARRHPERLLGLVLCCGVPRFDYAEELVAAIRAHGSPAQVDAALRLLTASQLDDADLRGLFLEFFPLYFFRYQDAYGQWLAHTEPFRAAAFLRYRNVLLPAADSLEWLAQIGAPTLVLAGRHDLLTPVDRGGERFAAGLPDSRLVVFEESGHFPFIEETDLFVTRVRDFVTEVGGAKRTPSV